MKLVVDNDTNIQELPVYNYSDIASCARRFGDELEAGKHGEPTRVILLLDKPTGLTVEYWGATANGLELMGLLSIAQHHLYETAGDDED